MVIAVEQRDPPWRVMATYRACDLCDHGVDVGGVRHCVCTGVTLPALPQPVRIARSAEGACGIEARFMAAPFLA